jgi:alanine racemase
MDSMSHPKLASVSDVSQQSPDPQRVPAGAARPLSAEQLVRTRVWVEVDLQALANNIRLILKQIHPAQMLLTVKKDAYGHGLLPVARVAEEVGVDYLGVACVGEGVALRSTGIAMPILNLGLALAEEIESAVANHIDLTVATLDDARQIAEIARPLDRRARAHLKIDTGMGRLGLFPEQLLDQVDAMAVLPDLEWIGLYSHLADVAGNPQLTREQLDRFQRVTEAMRSWLKLRHLGASGAIGDQRLHFDMLRVGIAAYGADSGARDFEPVLAFKSRIVFIKDFPPGRPISYGATYVTREPTRVGVVAAGYGNGYPRLVSNRGYVLVGGRVAPILGRICMDQMMISLNGHPEASVGDPVLLFGRQDDDSLPVWKVAEWAETIAYEVLCSVGTMNPRVYLRSAGPGGKSATGVV